MANVLKTNPVVVDTFVSDVIIRAAGDKANVKCITFCSPGADHALITDGAGFVVYDSRVAAGECDQQMIDTNFNGLIVDVSAGSYTAGARLLIYLV